MVVEAEEEDPALGVVAGAFEGAAEEDPALGVAAALASAAGLRV